MLATRNWFANGRLGLTAVSSVAVLMSVSTLLHCTENSGQLVVTLPLRVIALTMLLIGVAIRRLLMAFNMLFVRMHVFRLAAERN